MSGFKAAYYKLLWSIMVWACNVWFIAYGRIPKEQKQAADWNAGYYLWQWLQAQENKDAAAILKAVQTERARRVVQ